MNEQPVDRRSMWQALVAAFFGALVQEATQIGLNDGVKLFQADNPALTDMFTCWVPVKNFRLLVQAQPIVSDDIVKISVIKILGHLHGPTPCAAMLEIYVSTIVAELKKQSLEIHVDWSDADWGAFHKYKHDV